MISASQLMTIPNLLSLYRIAVIPVMIVLFYFDNAFTAWVNLILFALAGASDFLDGYLARRMGQTTLLGKVLDLLSDKLIVSVTLILLVAFDRLDGIWIIPVIIIYVRELMISSIREFMAHNNHNVAVSKLGKWKLTLQMFSMGWLVVGDYGDLLVPNTMLIGKSLFILATILTVVSGWDYMRGAWKTIAVMDNTKG